MAILKAHVKKIFVLLILSCLVRPGIAAATNDSHSKRKDASLEMSKGTFYDFILQQHHNIEEKLKSGDTNTPLLILEWFINDRYVQSCHVSRIGLAIHGDYGRMNANGRGSFNLDPIEQDLLVKTINKLPVAPPLPPQNRWLLVSGVRSNRWFTQVYDRADIPVEVEKLFSITRARLPWIVGDAESSTNIVGRYADTWVTFLQTASKAPIAVSGSAVASGRESNSIQLWDTKDWKEIMIPAVEEFTTWPWSTAVLSSDGQILAIGGDRGARAVALKTGKILWDVKITFNDDSRVVKQMAVIQNDKLLAVASRKSVELWDLLAGRKLHVLVTDEPEINIMRASRDGKFLAVVSDKKKLQIWDTEGRSVIRKSIDDPRYIHAIEFSPDNKYLAVAGAPYKDSFMLWDIKSGEKNMIPARGSQYHDEMGSLAWSADGKFFAATPRNRESLILYARTWKPIARWRGVGGGGCIAFAHDGILLARLKDGSLRGLNVSSLKSLIEQ